MTEEALSNMLNDESDKLNNLISQIQKFNTNIVGSNAYFHERRKELEALIQQEGLCTTWFTLLAADNYWLDLNQIIHGDRPLPEFASELEKAK